MLELKNINFSYDKQTPVLNEFNLKVKEGEIIAIQGQSGMGKSTILRIIAGLEIPSFGDVLLNEEDITKKKANERQVGYVFQNYALFPHLTVFKNIEYGLQNLTKEERRKEIEEISEKVDIKDLLDRYPHEISGGQKQRVALARTLVTKPNILLLDEPFTALDSELKTSIRKDVYDILKAFNITTVLVTHDEQDAVELKARVVKLKK